MASKRAGIRVFVDDVPNAKKSKTEETSLRSEIADQTDVFLKLAHQISSTEAKDVNLVFSPLSLHVVLSLIAAGSSGTTREELLSFLNSKSCEDLNKLASKIASFLFADRSRKGGPKLKSANGVWVDKSLPLKASFKDIVKGVFNAASENVDFRNHAEEVAAKVNSWAKEKTKGLIKELLPRGSVDDDTIKIILGNALYFKGVWNDKFDKSYTRQGDFHLLNGGSVKVPFMTNQKDQFVSEFKDFKVLGLPYQQGGDTDRQFSMYVFLPNKRDGLPSLMKEMSRQPGFLDKHLPQRRIKLCRFKFPRFKMSFGFEASKVLKSLGVEHAFKGGLTEMVDSSMGSELYVSSIFQKSFIEVDEEGTKAASATLAPGCKVGLIRPQPEFVADHPFIFVIREDKSGVVMFTGHVMNPNLEF